MQGLLFLAWKHASFRWRRSLLLLVSISLCLSTPLAIHWMTGDIERALLRRARDVPFLVGRPGSALDLVVASLYFRPQSLADLEYGLLEDLQQGELVRVLPVHLKHTARQAPIVGTTLEYFSRLGLEVAEGTLPLRLGDCVLGAGVAQRWQENSGVARVVCSRRPGLRQQQEAAFMCFPWKFSCRVPLALPVFFHGTACPAFHWRSQWHTTLE
jgi:putative ABC transport system permease protein